MRANFFNFDEKVQRPEGMFREKKENNEWFTALLSMHSIGVNLGSVLFIWLNSVAARDTKNGFVKRHFTIGAHFFFAIAGLFLAHIPVFFVAVYFRNMMWGMLAHFILAGCLRRGCFRQI